MWFSRMRAERFKHNKFGLNPFESGHVVFTQATIHIMYSIIFVLIPLSQVMWFSLPLSYLVLYVPVTPPFSTIDGLCFANAFVKDQHVMYLVHDTTS